MKKFVFVVISIIAVQAGAASPKAADSQRDVILVEPKATGAAADAKTNVQLLKTANEFQDYKKKSQGLQEKERKILGTMYKLNRRQRRLAIQKAEQLQKREELESDITQLQKNIETVSEQIKHTRKQIIARIRNLHRVNGPTIFQIFFGSQDITEMDRNARILYKISKSDVEQLRSFRGLKNLLDQQQLKLEKKLADFERNQKKLEKQETSIKSTYFAQMALLKNLENQDRAILDKLKHIKRKANLLSKNDPLDSLFESGLYEQRGQLELPTNGIITQKFGPIRLLQEKIRVYNKGWFISTAPGREANSVFKGKVAFVGPMQDYNNVLILDHGDHFYSVYANLGATSVKVGDEVETQQRLGYVEQSRFFGHGLYFEIRHFSQSEDLVEWFKDKGVNLSSVKEQNL